MRGLLFLLVVAGFHKALGLDAAGSVTIDVSSGQSPYFVPILNLFSYTNCSNDGLNNIGDRMYYIGNGYIPCDGPVTYMYDRGPPGKTDIVYMSTIITPIPGGQYFATFNMWNDSRCTMPYNFLGKTNSLFQGENTCRILTNDQYNPTAVVSASVLVGAAHHPTPSAAIAIATASLIAAILYHM